MKIIVKSGVWFAEINDYFLWFVTCLFEVWDMWGSTPTITSGADGKHMEGSFHPKSQAWDVRVFGIRDPASMSDTLRNRLNEDGNEWRVLYGDEHHRDHIHVEVHPKF